MSDAQTFLSRCNRVRKTGPDRWIACCPAHEDSNPSMNVKDVGGKLLVICRAGCSTEEILEAVQLPWSVLFEEKPFAYQRAVQKAFPTADILEALAHEALIVCIIAADVKRKKEIKPEEWERLALAYQRIDAARRMSLGH